MRERHYRPNWMMRIAGILLCLTLLSLHFSSNLYARYVSQDAASDGARVATFNVSQTGTLTQPFDIVLDPSQTQTYQITLENKGETAVQYTMTAQNLTGNLPLYLKWTDSTSAEVTDPVEGGFIANSGSATYTLTIGWEAGDNNFLYQKEIDHIVVTVQCVQVD